jgi:hypothetical protein
MYKYRLAEERDLDALIEMCLKFYEAHAESVHIPIDADSLSLSIMAMIEDQGLIVVVYESDSDESLPPVEEQGPVLGMLGFGYFRPPINMHVLAAQEKMFWLEPGHRSSSVARTMVTVAHIGLKADDVQYSYMTELANSPESVGHLYASMAYQPVEKLSIRKL